MSCEVPPIATLLSSFFNISPADGSVCLLLKTYCTRCCGEGGGSPCAGMKRSVSVYFANPGVAPGRLFRFVCVCLFGVFFCRCWFFPPFSLNVLRSLSFNNEKKTRVSRFPEWEDFSLSPFSSRSLSRFYRLI